MSMSRAHQVLWSYAIGVLAVACVYDPQPPDGVQKCYEQRCPDGYVCGIDDHCHKPESLPVPPGSGGMPVGTGGSTPIGAGGSGGVKGSGGVTGKGGVVGSGGVTGNGGMTSQGGATGYGGTTSTGGTTAPPNSGTVMTISDGQAQGAMTGYGYIASGSLDTVSDPTCASPAGPITSAVSCEETIWSTPTSYCVAGYIPALPSSPTSADFDANWGIQIGVTPTPDPSGVLGQKFTQVAATLTGSPLVGLRMVLHRKGDPETSSYCAGISPGVAVAFRSFNTACWDDSGVYLNVADVPNLDRVAIQVSSDSRLGAISVDNLCLVSITFGN